MWRSILQVPRCRIPSLSFLCTPRSSFGGLLESNNGFEASHAHALHARWFSRPKAFYDIKISELSNHRRELLDATVKQCAKNKSAERKFSSIRYSDAPPIILPRGNSKISVRIFTFDIGTTGLSRDDSITEIAIRDLSGGINSCFHTLVNPGRNVLKPYVPRMKDLIPILIKFVNSRLQRGEIPIFAAHNARRFDVRFLIKEFNRCSMNIPDIWLFLDNLPLAREWRKQNGFDRSKASLQALREYLQILSEGSSDGAMEDVNSLSSVLEKIVSDMKLTLSDLLERSFSANDLDCSKKNKKK